MLEDIRNCGADRTVSLGDNVGYGADSEAVLGRIIEHGIISVMGNHELAIVKPEMLKWFNPQAREAVLKVAEQLSAESREWIATLPDYMVLEGCRLVHGFPPDSVTKYLMEQSSRKIQQTMQKLPEDLAFCGHTHYLDMYRLNSLGLEHAGLKQKRVRLQSGEKLLVNAGAVGQPRDGDPHAKYLLYDTDQKSIEVRYVTYDIPSAQAKILALGFPRFFATRLGTPTWPVPQSEPGA